MEETLESLERQPLLGPIGALQRQIPDSNQSLVDFDPNGDSENPLEWPKAYKSGVVALLFSMAFTVTFTCIGVVPIAGNIVFDLSGQESKSASILLVTVWELGEAAGPLLIAPLSEIYGRYLVFNVANLFFVLGVALAALSPTVNILVFARFLTGLATASNVLNPAIIGDMFPSESRGHGMSMVMLAPLIGGAIGPAISGAIAETYGWRTIMYMALVLAVVCEVFFFTLLRETYKVPILQQRAARLRKETGDESLKCAFETEKGGHKTSSWSVLRAAITRPAIVLWDSKVLKVMSLYGAVEFTFYYVMATTLPEMLSDIYGFSPARTGLSFLTFSIGATAGITLCSFLVDGIYIKLGKTRGGVSIPEDRLPLMILSAFFFPFVVALYGWAPSRQWPVYILLSTVILLGFCLIFISITLASYIVDAFGIYSASGMTMLLITRCLVGTFLPMVVPLLTNTLGLGYGFLVLAAMCSTTIVMPGAVMRYGARWRQSSKYTRDNQ